MSDKYQKNSDGTYVGLNFTNFPAEVDSWQDSLDVSAEMLALANSYRAAMLANEITTAKDILARNPTLARMMIDADTINRLKHAVMALERMFDEDIEEYIKSYTNAASASATNAANSASAAARSASAAKTSETNASNSAGTASSKATEASNSAAAAAESKAAAATSATTASQKAAAASQSADDATNSATEAAGSKDAAAASLASTQTLASDVESALQEVRSSKQTISDQVDTVSDYVTEAAGLVAAAGATGTNYGYVIGADPHSGMLSLFHFEPDEDTENTIT